MNATPTGWFSCRRAAAALVALAALLFLLMAAPRAATAACGSIITPPSHGDVEDTVRPIADCINPFNADQTVGFSYELELAGAPVRSGELVTLSTATSSLSGRWSYNYPEAFGGASFFIFRKEADTYRQVFIAPEGEFTWEDPVPGEYVAVFVYTFNAVLNQKPWWQRLTSVLVPTAEAFFEAYEEVATVSFSIEAAPPPAGASSVLFLPGILGSRLYEENGECSLTGSIEVRERWVEISNCDLLRLSTNFLGESTHDIFTFSDERGRIDRAVSPDIYDSFIDAMDKWQDDELIEEYRVVPYDWRLSIDAVINTRYDAATKRLYADAVESYQDGYLYKTLSELADSSHSGRVTIVTHSNGGLVAKGFLRQLTLNNDPLLQKIDRLIMVAAPQVGTPESLWGLLHGTDLGFIGNGDAFLDKESSRQLMNKMAFAHHLLPNEHYFDRVDTAVVTFEDGVLTTPWKEKYGQIRDRATLHTFLDNESGRPKPEPSDLLQPEIVDAALLTYARTMESLLDWTPPESIQVVQVAGTGLETTAGLTYFTDRECVRFNFGFSFLGCTEYKPKIGYRVNTVIDGDQTVVAPSALYISKTKAEQWWVDLFNYNDNFIDRKHSNIFEVDEVVEFIEDRLLMESPQYNFISTTTPEFDGGLRLTFQLHSPLDLSVSTGDGEVSSSTNEISNAVYRQLGELQYLSLPADTPDIKLVLRGYAAGSFTLDIERHEGNALKERQVFSGIPSATSTVVTADVAADLPPVRLSLDVDGNGTLDMRYDESGVATAIVTYAGVRSYIQSLSLRPADKNILLVALREAERDSINPGRRHFVKNYQTAVLRSLVKIVQNYGKRNLLTENERFTLTFALESLLKQTPK